MTRRANTSRTANVKTRARVSQAELRRFLDLAKSAREYDRLRKSIVGRLEEGSEVESGELCAKLTVKYRRIWSLERVAEALGHREAKRLFDSLSTARYRCLDVR